MTNDDDRVGTGADEIAANCELNGAAGEPPPWERDVPWDKDTYKRETRALFAKANEKHCEATCALRTSLEAARDAGIALNQAKCRVRRGEWARVLAQEFIGSQSTAVVYMRVAREWERIFAVIGPRFAGRKGLTLSQFLYYCRIERAKAKAAAPPADADEPAEGVPADAVTDAEANFVRSELRAAAGGRMRDVGPGVVVGWAGMEREFGDAFETLLRRGPDPADPGAYAVDPRRRNETDARRAVDVWLAGLSDAVLDRIMKESLLAPALEELRRWAKRAAPPSAA